MPTGTGKTHLLASIIYDSLKENGKRCVWIVAHRRELVEQIEEHKNSTHTPVSEPVHKMITPVLIRRETTERDPLAEND